MRIPSVLAATAVGSLLAVVAAAVPADAATPTVACTSTKSGLAKELKTDITAALKGRSSTVSVALYDRTTGTTCTYRAGSTYDSASVVKATLLGALLRQAQEAGRVLTTREKKLATAMITKSDNDATTTLWKQVKVKGVQHFLDLAKMTHTTPGSNGYWGLTQITAADELKLLKLLTSSNSVLTKGSRTYELGLMNKVVSSQRWGVPAGAPSSATVHVKNGWLSRATHKWRVHSIGAFTGNGHDYGIVVLSHDDKSMDYGIATIERVARAVHADLK
ncbi:serine hydrolase [Streptomyces sp. NPDC059373]